MDPQKLCIVTRFADRSVISINRMTIIYTFSSSIITSWHLNKLMIPPDAAVETGNVHIGVVIIGVVSMLVLWMTCNNARRAPWGLERQKKYGVMMMMVTMMMKMMKPLRLMLNSDRAAFAQIRAACGTKGAAQAVSGSAKGGTSARVQARQGGHFKVPRVSFVS